MAGRDFAKSIREALATIPTEVAHSSTEPPPPSRLYIVPGHEGALDPDTALVVGDRGVGKSFWSAALNGEDTRNLIGTEFRRLNLSSIDVSWGFSAASGQLGHPSKRVFSELGQKGFDYETIWRTVVLHQIGQKQDRQILGDTWAARVGYVAQSAEREETLLVKLSKQLRDMGRRHLLVFDALDRSGDSWDEIRARVKALLRVCLDLRTESAIRLKLFMRSDMWDDRVIWTFPDSSKLQHGRVVLQWRRADLYGLLWHWLANSPESGEDFRRWCREHYRLTFEPIATPETMVFAVPHKLRVDEDVQSQLLADLASQYMGLDRRRGRTYTWLPNHLADAKGQVSPRSFLLALRRAQAVSRERGAKEAIHYEGIKEGVRDASSIRILELREDYPWIDTLLNPLSGMTVPCTEDELIEKWKEGGTVQQIKEETRLARAKGESYLPPYAIDEQQSVETKLIVALIEVGVLNRLTDDRLNIPDLFRVAKGIGRKGGVRAIR